MAVISDDDASKRIQIYWDMEKILLFIDVCIEHKEEGGAGQTFNWSSIETDFKKRSKLDWGKQTLKNKFDRMKRDWHLWKQLKGNETGLRWNPTLFTLDCSNEWWTKKIQENKKVKKFYTKGVEPQLENKWDQLYGDTLAIGNNVMAPSMNQTLDVHESIESNNDVDIDHHDLSGFEYNYGMSEEDNFVEELEQEATGLDGSQRPKKRTAETNVETRRPNKMKPSQRQSTGCTTFYGLLERLVSAIESHKKIDPNAPGTMNTSDVMRILNNLEGLDAGGRLWFFATTLLENATKRDFFLNMNDDKLRLSWIKYHFDFSGSTYS